MTNPSGLYDHVRRHFFLFCFTVSTLLLFSTRKTKVFFVVFWLKLTKLPIPFLNEFIIISMMKQKCNCQKSEIIIVFFMFSFCFTFFSFPPMAWELKCLFMCSTRERENHCKTETQKCVRKTHSSLCHFGSL